MRSLEQRQKVNIRAYVRTYSHTYIWDRPYIPSTTALCEGITRYLRSCSSFLTGFSQLIDERTDFPKWPVTLSEGDNFCDFLLFPGDQTLPKWFNFERKEMKIKLIFNTAADFQLGHVVLEILCSPLLLTTISVPRNVM